MSNNLGESGKQQTQGMEWRRSDNGSSARFPIAAQAGTFADDTRDPTSRNPFSEPLSRLPGNRGPSTTAAQEEVSITCLRERHRRSSFKALLADLMSLLPSDVLKGRRSLAEKIEGATDYVGFLEERVSQLKHDLSYTETTDGKKLKSAAADIARLVDVEVREVGSCLQLNVTAFKGQLMFSDLLLISEKLGLQTVTAFSTEIGDDRILLSVLVKSCAGNPSVGVREAVFEYLVNEKFMATDASCSENIN